MKTGPVREQISLELLHLDRAIDGLRVAPMIAKAEAAERALARLFEWAEAVERRLQAIERRATATIFEQWPK